MSTMSRTNGKTLRSLFLCFALAFAVGVLEGCSLVQSSPAREPVNPLVSAETQNASNNRRVRCSTTLPPPDKRLAMNSRLEAIAETTLTERASGSVRVPVFFHVITSSTGEGRVSEASLREQVRVLNDAFAGRAPGGPGAATAFRFDFADAEEIPNDVWFNMEYRLQAMPAEIQAKARNRGGKSALNIYTVNVPNRPFGWARFPWDPENVQGIVIGFKTLPGGTEISYNEGDTATHEVGHWLGLFHTFENGCNSPGDHVDDTPPERGATAMCPAVPPDSCPGDRRDSINNFMNFTNDRCMFQFTPEQARRMDLVHQQLRTEGPISQLRR